jgi:(2Fe-2S) ferredoxin
MSKRQASGLEPQAPIPSHRKNSETALVFSDDWTIYGEVNMPRPDKHVFICLNSRPPGHPKGSCTERGAEGLVMEFGRLLEEREAWNAVKITRTSCLGPCELGPTVLVYPEGVMYVGVQTGDVEEIFDQHLLGGTPVDRLRAPAEIWS